MNNYINFFLQAYLVCFKKQKKQSICEIKVVPPWLFEYCNCETDIKIQFYLLISVDNLLEFVIKALCNFILCIQT